MICCLLTDDRGIHKVCLLQHSDASPSAFYPLNQFRCFVLFKELCLWKGLSSACRLPHIPTETLRLLPLGRCTIMKLILPGSPWLSTLYMVLLKKQLHPKMNSTNLMLFQKDMELTFIVLFRLKNVYKDGRILGFSDNEPTPLCFFLFVTN